MKNRVIGKIAATIAIGLGLFPLVIAHAGIRDGGGGDTAKSPSKTHGWFFDSNRSIIACLNVSPTFGLSRDQVLPQLKQAFTAWKTYIDRKHINEKYGMLGGKLQFTTEVTYRDACTGTEDITFNFGTDNGDIQEAKKLFDDPVAMAVLKDFDKQNSWGKGFIWVAPEKSMFNGTYPNWHYQDNVLTILLHEIGHVYGNPHVPGTIMTEQIMTLLNQEISSTAKTSIDIFRELYHCPDCGLELNDYAVTNSDGKPNATHRLMARILGHPFSGMTKVTLTQKAKSADYGIVIYDIDRKMTDSFTIKVTGERTIDGPFVFSNAWLGWATSAGKIYYGYLTNSAGQKINMVLESNLVDYSQSMPEFSTLMRVNGFVDGEFADLVTYRIQHQLN